jgi:transposase
LPDDLDDAGLEALLFPPPPDVPTDQRPVPDWSAIHREMRRPNVTLALLWEEYRDETVDGFGYSWFCDLYRAWVGQLRPTLRQVHTAGEKLFVDFAGHTMEVVDGATGEIQTAQIFVAALGASSFIYAEATSMPRRPGAKRCRTGSRPTSTRWRRSEACRGRSSATISSRVSARPASTSRR